jgi:hypothetical protein
MSSSESARLQQKLFEQRRAGLLPQDLDADAQHMDSMRILERDPITAQPLPPRPLTDREKDQYRNGELAHAVVVRVDVLEARDRDRLALERSTRGRRAERAALEAARLAREAKRFG